MLRINEAQITDGLLLPIAQHHRQEDLGHDIWFFARYSKARCRLRRGTAVR